jgi:hypothetical protein
MGLFVFSFTMMAGYLLFLESDEVRSLLNRFGGKKFSRLKQKEPASVFTSI